ncbi:MAG: EamA family transporter [Alphaproteobacteria bacterium]|nr:EamA family transporter [Alphaproteobacteria bacterium]
MRIRDMALAALTSVAWGLAFVATRLALDGFSAPQLTALRFIVAALPVFFVPRPKIAPLAIVLIGLTLFTGQFLLLFFAFGEGLPPGLASVSQQMQAFFTVLLAALFLRDVPSPRQCLGMAVAFAGLAVIGATVGADLKPLALGLALAGALSWAIGNVLVKRHSAVPIFPLMVWCSLVPPLPSLLLSSVTDARSLVTALGDASWLSIAAALYLGTAATLFGYAAWGSLLRRYPAAMVTPFALLAPCTGIVSSALVFGEVFGPLRYAGMALILAGLAVIVLPGGRRPFTAPGGTGR